MKKGEVIMRKLSTVIALVVALLTCLFFATTALAGRGGKGNGFPCGEHYNLNLISKKDGFICPDESTYSLTDQNVIYIPVDNAHIDPIQIYMESGKKKDRDNYTEFKVTDWCAGLEGGDTRASLMVPANQDGYAVYARAVGTLGENLNIEIFDPNLDFVKDENQNDLLALGLIGPGGVTSFLSDSETIYRKKGGKSNKAVPITDLFLWTGDICYFSDTDITGYQCCIDTDSDGAYDDCVDPDLVTGSCPLNHVLESVSCTHYDDYWVFNIADFVSAFWKMDNNGVKLLQIRFYPLPLCNE
jgi:hypothetical protein